MLLKPNMKWTANQGIIHPMVTAEFSQTPNSVIVKFTVEEPADCYRAAVQEDNGRSWEDSCVEVFLQNPDTPAEYFNFETTSRGFVLAARGSGRENRQTLPLETIAKIKRSGSAPSIQDDSVYWCMTIEIPAEIFGIKSFKEPLRGNLYKCADKANTPHYLSAFPIETEKPDFHRPEFFQILG
ncbi:MAG: hypothetical protein IKG78_02470 [Fibrobacter sp.]|nr:hypothetical protein [Fibrobacter sp.]